MYFVPSAARLHPQNRKHCMISATMHVRCMLLIGQLIIYAYRRHFFTELFIEKSLCGVINIELP